MQVPKLEQSLSQNLVMTPQLQQAIKLLQYSNAELAAYIDAELERNPILNREDGEQLEVAQTEHADNASSDSSTLLDQANMAGLEDSPLDTDFTNDYDPDIAGAGTEIQYEDSYSSLPGTSSGTGQYDGNFDKFSNITSSTSLRDHLLQQIQLDIVDTTERLIAAHLIDYLDEAGWFIGDIAEIAERLNSNAEIVAKVLNSLQTMDPPGIFARTLTECLCIQLREQGILDNKYKSLCDNLNMLVDGKIKKLANLCKVDIAELTDMMVKIRSLNPKPAAGFDSAPANAIIPDILMHMGKNGQWFIELNQETLPKVGIDNDYYHALSARSNDREDSSFLSNNYQHAKWLCNSIKQRAKTILKVSAEIVRQQDSFFRYGISHLRPLVLRDIASAVDLHESTVSRVTSNKYIHTPRGIYELKYFFTSALTSASGNSTISAEAVRYRINKLIEEEDANDIRSDDTIVEMLRAEGIDIARRTVAKYREAMHIPSSIQRRKQKKMRI
ncbi:MAG: RNA polymerase factor sigma-54 [Pseudomonadota bacterium]